jgi:hypothetical protein
MQQVSFINNQLILNMFRAYLHTTRHKGSAADIGHTQEDFRKKMA